MISKNETAWSLTAVLIHLLLSTSLLSAWKRWYHKNRLSASDTLALYVYDYNVTYGIFQEAYEAVKRYYYLCSFL